MAEPKEKSWVEKILPGFFRQDDSPSEDEHVLHDQSEQVSTNGNQKHQDELSAVDISTTTSTITGKLAALKTALEFEGKDKSRLSEIGSSRELLLYLYEVVLFKFNELYEIGLLSFESSEVVGQINDMLQNFLKRREASEQEGSQSFAELRDQYEALQRKHDALQAKYLETGIITEREIQIEKECNYLKSRIRELETFLRIAQKKISILTSTADMVQSLRAKNSLLTSKIDHQTRLLKSLTAGQPQSQELLSTIEKLNSENDQMKMKLEKQGELWQQFESHLPVNSSTRAMVKDLVAENTDLAAELDQKQDHLESLSVNQLPDMFASVDQLQDENIQLKSRLKASQSLSRLLADCRQQEEQAGEFENMLQSENMRLKQLLAAKKQQIKALASDPSKRQFVQAITRLKGETRELRKISDQNAKYIEQLLAERRKMQAKLRQNQPLAEESRRFKAELEFQKKLVASYRKTEYEYQMLKKKYYKVNNRYLIAQNENDALKRKLNRLAVEYNSLVQEYENLFGKN